LTAKDNNHTVSQGLQQALLRQQPQKSENGVDQSLAWVSHPKFSEIRI
jgi:hypothetical protein